MSVRIVEPGAPTSMVRVMIEDAAAFSFVGPPMAWVELDSGDVPKRWIYRSYVVGANGVRHTDMCRHFGESMAAAITDLQSKVGPVCVIWRTVPEAYRDQTKKGLRYVRCRMAVVDKLLNQHELGVMFEKAEGEPAMVLQ